MALDKTKIYSLEGMNEQDVKDFFVENDITVLWLECIFLMDDIADESDLIEWDGKSWAWCFNYDYEGAEIIKVKNNLQEMRK